MTVQRYSEITANVLLHRGCQIYPILIGAAHNRQTLTYGMVADLLGYEGAGVLDRQLGLLMYWCDDHGLPPVTVLVVNSATGLPGVGLMKLDDLHASREAVFNFNWYDLVAPDIETLRLYEGKLRTKQQT